MKVKCAGIIPLRYIRGRPQVYLVHHRHGGHWGFPKGHIEKGEHYCETALREFKEETPLMIEDFLPFKPIHQKYTYAKENGMAEKEIIYLVAYCKKGPFRSLENDIVGGDWYFFPEAYQKLQYLSSQETLKQVESLLCSLSMSPDSKLEKSE